MKAANVDSMARSLIQMCILMIRASLTVGSVRDEHYSVLVGSPLPTEAEPQ